MAISELKRPKGWGVGGGDSRYPGADMRGLGDEKQTGNGTEEAEKPQADAQPVEEGTETDSVESTLGSPPPFSIQGAAEPTENIKDLILNN